MDEKELLDIENIEIKLLLDAIYMRYGYDYRDYTLSHVKRRVLYRLERSGCKTISELMSKVLYDYETFGLLQVDLSINVTEMFRYPQFFTDLREKVIPMLKTYPSIKIWHAGCSTGEEVVSMAILLKEEGLLGKSTIYATDINEHVLAIAEKGIYDIKHVQAWTKNYQEAGGNRSFSEYYTAKFDSVIFDQDLYDHIVFTKHNLIQDKQFITANLIVCRNVLIYFNKGLKNTVLDLLDDSLVAGGILGIGSKESLQFTSLEGKYDTLSSKGRIYKKQSGLDYE
ncbi:protein-glutamate O-methyltransferase CheR [Acidaminobacter sp. JC074]|uniref:CheR family methyltransferase n=1 Tax=Acidaminobacter sp. JC074 TaxID=2530199 RepID=UPI001F10D32A|nr:protein-glutamate O-methyltransferase CheR [Acidaminobacter sp. JC074]MCH4887881.1 protein-glutamate O-methyltransferase CheR [Acidaminobacter sp. JC074]